MDCELVAKINKEVVNLRNEREAQKMYHYAQVRSRNILRCQILGVRMGPLRKLLKSLQYLDELQLPELKALLHAQYFEQQVLGLLLLIEFYNKLPLSALYQRTQVYELYWTCRNRVCTWDFLDIAPTTLIGYHSCLTNNYCLIQLALNNSSQAIQRLGLLAATYWASQHPNFNLVDLLTRFEFKGKILARTARRIRKTRTG